MFKKPSFVPAPQTLAYGANKLQVRQIFDILAFNQRLEETRLRHTIDNLETLRRACADTVLMAAKGRP
ncbi:hypothetical protein [Dyella agri]|uniref:Uncharacterized protein n=1 Tax=Dyella agri TaxID=1926869 RepID=A0ABW8KMF1_9GAMM